MKTSWQLEVNDPRQSTGCKAIREFSEELSEIYKDLIHELNQINDPIQLRIEREPD